MCQLNASIYRTVVCIYVVYQEMCVIISKHVIHREKKNIFIRSQSILSHNLKKSVGLSQHCVSTEHENLHKIAIITTTTIIIIIKRYS